MSQKASPRLAAWIKQQIESAAKYVPNKGGVCNICGAYCRTNRTDPETRTRYHKCPSCGNNFKTSGASIEVSEVGRFPTSIDSGSQTLHNKDSEQDKKPRRKR